MIKDLLVSFKDNFKEKSHNPFLGLYAIVWLVRNWELVYTLFNFDKGTKLENKVKFVETYYAENSFLESLGWNILWSFGMLLLSYGLLALARLIVNFSEMRVIPFIYKITDSKSIVLKSVYQHVKSERDDLQNRLDEERDSKAKLESRIKELEQKISNESNENNLAMEEYMILANKIKESNLASDFLTMTTHINQGTYIPNDNKQKDTFVELGLIEYGGSYGTGTKQYKITEVGQKVLRHLRLQ